MSSERGPRLAIVVLLLVVAGLVGLAIGWSEGEDAPDLGRWRALVGEVARAESVDPDLLLALVAAESGGDAQATSRAGARGLAQLMPATAAEEAVRREAIDLTKKGIDAAREAGSNLMTIWLGQDGFDYAFQADYTRMWQHEIDGIREVCAHDPDCLISIEYKPNEPRSYSLMPDAATTLLAIKDVGAENLGVTLDFAHVLYADEQPAFAAALIARHSRVLGVHLNDGYAKRDDGLMVGAVHTLQTIELLRQIRRDGYGGAIYFDTFPDLTGLDPVHECEVNIGTVRRMLKVVDRLEQDNRLASAIDRQDAVSTQAIVQELMFGADH